MSAISREWTHNVHRERVPRPAGLYGPGCPQAVTVVAPELTLWAALCDLYAETATSLVEIAGVNNFHKA